MYSSRRQTGGKLMLYNTSVEVRATGKVKKGQEKEGIRKTEVRRTARMPNPDSFHRKPRLRL